MWQEKPHLQGPARRQLQQKSVSRAGAMRVRARPTQVQHRSEGMLRMLRKHLQQGRQRVVVQGGGGRVHRGDVTNDPHSIWLHGLQGCGAGHSYTQLRWARGSCWPRQRQAAAQCQPSSRSYRGVARSCCPVLSTHRPHMGQHLVWPRHVCSKAKQGGRAGRQAGQTPAANNYLGQERAWECLQPAARSAGNSGSRSQWQQHTQAPWRTSQPLAGAHREWRRVSSPGHTWALLASSPPPPRRCGR